jgi:hypothetical protein
VSTCRHDDALKEISVKNIKFQKHLGLRVRTILTRKQVHIEEQYQNRILTGAISVIVKIRKMASFSFVVAKKQWHHFQHDAMS